MSDQLRAYHDYLPMWVIYASPKDYPGRIVVREWRIMRGGEQVAMATPTATVRSLTEARQAIPPGLVRMDRMQGDDPVIVEVWL